MPRPYEFSNLGFIGLGAMGAPMLSHLARKLPEDSRIWVYDVVEQAVDDVCAEFPNKVFKGKNAKDVAQQAAGHDYHNGTRGCASFYDAPVSGGVVGAIKGTIAFFLGCGESDANMGRLTYLLGLMGGQVIPCGGPSLGLAAKLSNNYLSGIIAIACSEAFDMGMRSGLDPRTLAKVYAAGTAQNTICDKFCPVPHVYPEAPSSGGWKQGFKVQLMRKDFGLAVDMAKRVGSQNVLGEVGLKTYDGAANDPRCRDLDSRVVYRYLGGQEDWQAKLNGT
ncbi:6-phosphogluconate dehydrogenase [Bipolaris maydis]|nr:6-phosphogluconate dehydrogenase [Bipolaris maydis]